MEFDSLRKEYELTIINLKKAHAGILTAMEKAAITRALEEKEQELTAVEREINNIYGKIDRLKKQISDENNMYLSEQPEPVINEIEELRHELGGKISALWRQNQAMQEILKNVLQKGEIKESKRKQILENSIKIEKANLELLPTVLNRIPEWFSILLKNQRPAELQRYGIGAAELSEIYAYKLFTNLFALNCVLWGNTEVRFREFSDGFFQIPSKNIVCLYDTKARRKYYNASKEILKSAHYVKKHKSMMLAIRGSEIRYFMIISSEFGGDPRRQKSRFYEESGAKLILSRAEDLSFFAAELQKISDQVTVHQAVDWEEILSRADPILTKQILEKELDRLKNSFKQFLN
jgi:hypothetical protein